MTVRCPKCERVFRRGDTCGVNDAGEETCNYCTDDKGEYSILLVEMEEVKQGGSSINWDDKQ